MFLLKNYNHEKKKVKILNNFWSPHQTRERKRSKPNFSHFFAKIFDFFQVFPLFLVFKINTKNYTLILSTLIQYTPHKKRKTDKICHQVIPWKLGS